jgi:hypothetical protein
MSSNQNIINPKSCNYQSGNKIYCDVSQNNILKYLQNRNTLS